MEQNEIERYKQEMMKLYGRSNADKNESAAQVVQTENVGPSKCSGPETPGEDYEGVSEEIGDVDENAPDDTAYAPYNDENNGSETEDEDEYNDRYPDPDLSDLDTDNGTDTQEDIDPPEYASEEALGDSQGYILAYVRTGDESSPVAGATVMITAVVDGARVMIASGLTNENGATERFTVPAPGHGHSQSPDPSERPYSLYDVSVTAEDFFNARSVDVPVFSGITSIQNFSMIPVPLFMDSSDETVTYYNQEPSF